MNRTTPTNIHDAFAKAAAVSLLAGSDGVTRDGFLSNVEFVPGELRGGLRLGVEVCVDDAVAVLGATLPASVALTKQCVALTQLLSADDVPTRGEALRFMSETRLGLVLAFRLTRDADLDTVDVGDAVERFATLAVWLSEHVHALNLVDAGLPLSEAAAVVRQHYARATPLYDALDLDVPFAEGNDDD